MFLKQFSKLFRLSKNEWPLIFKGLFFLAISSSALLFYPSTIKDIIDEVISLLWAIVLKKLPIIRMSDPTSMLPPKSSILAKIRETV